MPDDGGAAELMSLRAYAAIELCVPNSGMNWLDEMIREAQKQRFAGMAMPWVPTALKLHRVDGDITKLEIAEAGRVAIMAYEIAGAMLTECKQQETKTSDTILNLQGICTEALLTEIDRRRAKEKSS